MNEYTIFETYEKLRSLVPLFGESYDPIIKALAYCLLGDVVKQNPIEIGSGLDTRIPLLIPLPSGYGKKELELAAQKTIEGVGRTYAHPTSMHPEQLVGKIIRRGKSGSEETIPNHGYLSRDFLVFEEAFDLLTSPHMETARDYITGALNTIGQNRVTKKSVNDLECEKLSFCPKCSAIFFVQPLPLPSNTVRKGLFRRLLIPYTYIPFEERNKALDDRLRYSRVDNNQKWEEFILFLTDRSQDKKWIFQEDFYDNINSHVRELLQHGRDRGKESRHYTDIMHFQLQNLLIRMTVIQAADKNRAIIENEDITNAYIDLKQFWGMQLDFVTNKILGTLSYETKLDNKLLECLIILDREGAYSFEKSSLSIHEYDRKIAKIFNVGIDSARLTYRKKLRDMGYIDSKQVGPHDSRVWLTEKGIRMLHPNTLNTLEENQGQDDKGERV